VYFFCGYGRNRLTLRCVKCFMGFPYVCFDRRGGERFSLGSVSSDLELIPFGEVCVVGF